MISVKVNIENINEHNFEKVISLKLLSEQEDNLSSNLYSIAQSKIYPSCIPRVITLDKKVVGFIMYTSDIERGNPNNYYIIRFMVDHNYQNKGIGKKALKLVLTEILSIENLEKIKISYWPRNLAARNLYKSLGFEEVGHDENGEMVAELKF